MCVCVYTHSACCHEFILADEGRARSIILPARLCVCYAPVLFMLCLCLTILPPSLYSIYSTLCVCTLVYVYVCVCIHAASVKGSALSYERSITLPSKLWTPKTSLPFLHATRIYISQYMPSLTRLRLPNTSPTLSLSLRLHFLLPTSNKRPVFYWKYTWGKCIYCRVGIEVLMEVKRKRRKSELREKKRGGK